MISTVSRRQFLATLGAAAGTTGLSGCLSDDFPGNRESVDRTIYVGAYHWGFVLLDGGGEEQNRFVLDRGTSIRLVAFNTSAEQALESLPTSVRNAIPDHHELEARNEDQIPPPKEGGLHELLEEANEQYPDHSVAVMSSGRNHMGSGMWGDRMMMHPVALPRDATRPTTVALTASQRGDYTLSCLTYCGYGHVYMDRDSALVVR